MQPVHKNKPDSTGLVPGIHFRRRNGPDGDARNKSGHDVKGHDERGAGAAAGTPAWMS